MKTKTLSSKSSILKNQAPKSKFTRPKGKRLSKKLKTLIDNDSFVDEETELDINENCLMATDNLYETEDVKDESIDKNDEDVEDIDPEDAEEIEEITLPKKIPVNIIITKCRTI